MENIKQQTDDERIIHNAIHIIRDSMNGVNVPLPLSIYKECIALLEKQVDNEQKHKQHFIALTKYELSFKEDQRVVVSTEPHTIGFKPLFSYAHKVDPIEIEVTCLKIENEQLMIGVGWGLDFDISEFWHNAETEDISISTYEQCL